VYDGHSVIQELNGLGIPVAQYTQGLGIDEPLASVGTGGSYFYHADGLASITSLTGAAGGVAASYVYDSFGKLTASTGTVTNPFQFTAREFDSETGLYYYRTRYYNPSVGRFTSEDPNSLRADTNFHRYVYTNPVVLEDPLGFQAGNANTRTYGEIGRWSWLPAPGYPAPPGLADAKASIEAACTLNGGGCNAVDGSGASNPISRAAWNNIVNANGKDESGGGNYMCVGGQGCWFVLGCWECMKGTKIFANRPKKLEPSGSVEVGGHTVYFYKDPLQGWCNEADRNSGCKCKN
jgi:RHS repeat-associated protein